MNDVVIRPSMKLARTGYSFAFAILVAAVMAYNNVEWLRGRTPWLLAVPALLFLFPLKQHVRIRFTRLSVQGDSIRFQSGILSKSTRIVKAPLIQDVRVEQGLLQRLIGIGDVTIETTRGEDDLLMRNVDDPERVAEIILGISANPGGEKSKR